MVERNVFLIPVDRDPFDKTVATPIDLTEQAELPEPFTDYETVRVGGIESGEQNRSTFERMTEDDLLLFYVDDHYVATGRVGETVEDEDGRIGETVRSGHPAPLLYTIESYVPIDVPRAAVNHVFEYDANYVPHNPMRVAESRLSRSVDAIELALQRYGE